MSVLVRTLPLSDSGLQSQRKLCLLQATAGVGPWRAAGMAAPTTLPQGITKDITRHPPTHRYLSPQLGDEVEVLSRRSLCPPPPGAVSLEVPSQPSGAGPSILRFRSASNGASSDETL